MPGKHMGLWPRCATCGHMENAHPYRHPFKYPRPRTNPDVGPRCGECRLGLGAHNTADPLCDHHERTGP